jgi:hypothetical protein
MTDDHPPLVHHVGRIDVRFRTTIQQSGKTATGIQVPAEVIEALGGGKRPAVTVTINGYTYRSTVAVMGGRYMVGVNAEHRARAGVAGGEEVDVDIDLDTAPREVSVPADFAVAWMPSRRPGAPSRACPTATSPGMCCRSRGPRPTGRGSAASRSRSTS